ncbi:potassium channel family protein [Maritalea myrionectae]|nr:potassium channel family protein [Maritalea myrionectae]
MQKISVFWHGLKAAFGDEIVRTILTMTIAIILFATLIYMLIEGWGPIDALYFTVMTISTVGYGDITPETNLGKLFTVVYVISGMGIFVALVTRIANTMLRQSVDEFEKFEEAKARKAEQDADD